MIVQQIYEFVGLLRLLFELLDQVRVFQIAGAAVDLHGLCAISQNKTAILLDVEIDIFG